MVVLVYDVPDAFFNQTTYNYASGTTYKRSITFTFHDQNGTTSDDGACYTNRDSSTTCARPGADTDWQITNSAIPCHKTLT